MTTTTLFAIPWSGASASVYFKWRKLLRGHVRFVPLELAGRGTRMREPLYADWHAATADVARLMGDSGIDGPWAVFGHSLGGLLGYEAVRRLVDEGRAPPVHLFVSGSNPPTWTPTQAPLHEVVDDLAFLERIFPLGGTPLGLLQDPDLRSLFAPVIRNDYRLFETYRWTPPERALTCPVTVLGGALDPLATPENLAGWRALTTGPCDTVIFPGGNHFFLEPALHEVVAIVQTALGSPSA